jgi:hypothetical protein
MLSDIATAQEYKRFLDSAEISFKQEKYFEAYESYDVARIFGEKIPKIKKMSEQGMKKSIVGIKKQQRIADSLLIVANTEKEKAIKNLAKANKANVINQQIINTMYWVGGNLAITIDKYGKYGFINKKGNIVIEPQFNKLIDINYYGHALMQGEAYYNKKQKYLISGDAKVHVYTRNVNENITVLDLTPKVFHKRLFKPNLKKLVRHKELEIIIADRCRIKKLPKEIINLKNLAYLDLNHNQLSCLPKEIGSLKNLTKLSLSNNQLSNLPKEIGNQENLTYLNLINNKLTDLPKEIGNLKNLSTLSLSSNQLAGLPKEIGNLKNLNKLYLRNNKLTRFPIKIVDMKNLTELDIDFNKLSSLPKKIGNLKNLIALNLGVLLESV